MRRRLVMSSVTERAQPRRAKQSCTLQIHRGAVSFSDRRSKFHRLRKPAMGGSRHEQKPESQRRKAIRIVSRPGALAWSIEVETGAFAVSTFCDPGAGWFSAGASNAAFIESSAGGRA